VDEGVEQCMQLLGGCELAEPSESVTLFVLVESSSSSAARGRRLSRSLHLALLF